MPVLLLVREEQGNSIIKRILMLPCFFLGELLQRVDRADEFVRAKPVFPHGDHPHERIWMLWDLNPEQRIPVRAKQDSFIIARICWAEPHFYFKIWVIILSPHFPKSRDLWIRKFQTFTADVCYSPSGVLECLADDISDDALLHDGSLVLGGCVLGGCVLS